jgi:signal transduction histidine kinase
MKFSIITDLSGKDAVIKTDKEKVYAIINNHVKNAIKFTQSGYIEFG